MALWGLLGCSDPQPVAVLEPEAAALQRLGSACSVVIAVGGMDAADADHLARVRDGNVMSLRLRDVTCPNSALAELAALSSLIHLDLSRTSINSLEHVPTLDLADLILLDTPISSLADIERLSPSYLDLRGTRVTSLEDLPASVTVLHAQGLGLTVPEGRTFAFIDVGNGDESKSSEAAILGEESAGAEPPASVVDGGLGDRWRQASPGASGALEPDGTVVGVVDGAGLVFPTIPMDDRGGGRFELRAEGGQAVVWLKDADGAWEGVLVGGELVWTQGRVQHAGFGEALFYVDLPPGGGTLHWSLAPAGNAEEWVEAVSPWAEMNPTPLDAELPAVRSSSGAVGRSHCSQLDGICEGVITSGSGILTVEMSPFDRSAGRVSLSLESGSARIWLKDRQGTWRAYSMTPGELELYGHFEPLEHQRKRWFVEPQADFAGLAWKVW
ncbi:MAG: hypothetical protein GY913_24075 [Proteobacteria bacterium]|nr:hypothetical protein [Pseudomonadota bacterium]